MNEVGPPERRDHCSLEQINDPDKKETLLEIGGIGREKREKRALKSASSRQPCLRNDHKTPF